MKENFKVCLFKKSCGSDFLAWALKRDHLEKKREGPGRGEKRKERRKYITFS